MTYRLLLVLSGEREFPPSASRGSGEFKVFLKRRMLLGEDFDDAKLLRGPLMPSSSLFRSKSYVDSVESLPASFDAALVPSLELAFSFELFRLSQKIPELSANMK